MTVRSIEKVINIRAETYDYLTNEAIEKNLEISPFISSILNEYVLVEKIRERERNIFK